MNEKYPATSRTDMERLSNLSDLEVASDSPDVRGWDVATTDDRTIGTVDDLIVDTREMKARYLLVDLTREARGTAASDADRHVLVPVSRAHVDSSSQRVHLDVASAGTATLPRFTGTVAPDYDDSYRRTVPPAKIEKHEAAGRSDTAHRTDGDAKRITRSAEELKIGRRAVPAGEVRVSKHVETERVKEPVTRTREDVKVERRPASGDAAGRANIGEDEIRVPITEEEVVVEKRPVVKEELVLNKERKTETEDVEADVRKERIDVDRTGGPTRKDRTR